jgi:NADH-quinone oxidoreductase subunit C
MAEERVPETPAGRRGADGPAPETDRLDGRAVLDGWAVEEVAPGALLERCRRLRAEGFNQLVDLTAVDWPGREGGRFDVVVHLRAVPDGRRLRLVCRTGGRVPSLTSIWPAADWAEREAYDLFGVVFEGHPDLRRILLPDDWEGHPLRRDYPIRGPRELNRGGRYAV